MKENKRMDDIKELTRGIVAEQEIDFGMLPFDENTALKFVVTSILEHVADFSHEPTIREVQLLACLCAVSLENLVLHSEKLLNLNTLPKAK